MMTPAITFNHVYKKFKKGERLNALRDVLPAIFSQFNQDHTLNHESEFWALHDINFEVPAKQVVGIMGPNGAGKSTMLKLLSSILQPTLGEVKIHGRLSALIEVTAGFHPDLTGRENIYLNGTILGMRKKEIDKKFDAIVEFSGVQAFIDTPVKRYSSGMYSRLGFSVAAHMDPDILIIDEVLSVGDAAFGAKCAHQMQSLLKSGCTILLVSHQLHLIEHLCQRLILLDKGHIIGDGPLADILPLYHQLIASYQKQGLKDRIAKDGNGNQKEVLITLDQVSHELVLNHQDKSQISMHVDVNYTVVAPLEIAHMVIDIVRGDGVICCQWFSQHAFQSIPLRLGSHQLRLTIPHLHLLSGTYQIKVMIWDKGMIYPQAMFLSYVCHIEKNQPTLIHDAIYDQHAVWTIQQ